MIEQLQPTTEKRLGPGHVMGIFGLLMELEQEAHEHPPTAHCADCEKLKDALGEWANAHMGAE